MKRECGGCTLCCKLLPVREGVKDGDPRWAGRDVVLFDKPAGERCPHQRSGKGCAIYESRPNACRKWNCYWLVGEDASELPRPDRAGFVVDICPDFIRITNNDTGEDMKLPVLQVWIDPARRREAVANEGLRAFLDRKAIPGLLRYSSTEAEVIFPPSICADRQWHIKSSNVGAEPEHTPEEVAQVWQGEQA